MEILAGIVLCLFFQGLFLLGRLTWRKTLPPRVPQPPLMAAQMANAEVFDEEHRYHPQLVSMRFKRRTQRGRRLREKEEEYDPFE